MLKVDTMSTLVHWDEGETEMTAEHPDTESRTDPTSEVVPNVRSKVVAITGASSGIGRACALRLAESGARVVLGARRADVLRELVDEILDRGGEADFVAADVRRQEDLRALVELAQARFGRLDVLLNNAGVMPISPMADLRIEDWEDMVDVNLRGVLYGIAAALPVFLSQGDGHFVTISSTATLQARPAMAVYAGTKAAVTTVSEWMRQELAGAVRVTTIFPGMTNTDFANTMTNPQIRQQLEARRDELSLSPSAIAGAVAYAIGQPADVEVSDVVVRPRG
jgi:NADP-dependent 3-hydroxy acid dehydrogenase YdfG